MRMPFDLKPGDVIAFAAANPAAICVNVFTWGWPLRWPADGLWTGIVHVGICAEHYGDLLLFEATRSLDEPCVVQDKVVHGVQAHMPISRVLQHCGAAWAYRLRMPLRAADSNRLSEWCVRRLGTAYDERGAVQSRTTLLGWLLRPKRESLVTLFCSEFVAAALRAVGQFRTLDASRWNPNSLCRELVNRGVTATPDRIGGSW